jgi:hypothetical protein
MSLDKCNKVMRVFVLIILVFCTLGSKAQEFQAPATTNQVLNNYTKPFVPKKTRAIALPFIEDFSYPGPYPNPLKWTDNQVYINNTFGINVISQGVATFDALNANGRSYHSSGFPQSFLADSLTSAAIDLGGLTAADSVYLSFFIQPQGNGFRPETADSLMLFFKTSTSNWINIWSKEGSPNTPFSQVLIPVTSSLFLHNDFQFRFINKASPNSNDDVWNLDYIKLGKNRTKIDTVINDMAFAAPPSNILELYTSLPYRHFVSNMAALQNDTFTTSLKNNYTLPYTVGVQLNASVSQPTVSTLATNTINVTVPNNNIELGYYPPYSIAYAPPNPTDKVVFNHKYYYNKLNINEYTPNDTIDWKVEFDNYFAYDDGSNEKAYYLLSTFGADASTAVSFTLNQADTLRGLGIYFANQVPSAEGKMFKIILYQNINIGTSTATVIKQQDSFTVQYTNAYNGFSTYKFDEPIALTAGTYYLGTTQLANTGADTIYFGLDANTNANSSKFYYNVDGTWNQSIVNGTTMLRPIVGADFVATSIAATTKNNSNYIYPNPASKVCYIGGPLSNTDNKYVIISNTGAIVQKGSINYNAIDVSKLTTGLYYIQLLNNKHQAKQIIPLHIQP